MWRHDAQPAHRMGISALTSVLDRPELLPMVLSQTAPVVTRAPGSYESVSGSHAFWSASTTSARGDLLNDSSRPRRSRDFGILLRPLTICSSRASGDEATHPRPICPAHAVCQCSNQAPFRSGSGL